MRFRYGCRHRLRLAPFIQQDAAHAGHTGARLCRAGSRCARPSGLGRRPTSQPTPAIRPRPCCLSEGHRRRQTAPTADIKSASPRATARGAASPTRPRSRQVRATPSGAARETSGANHRQPPQAAVGLAVAVVTGAHAGPGADVKSARSRAVGAGRPLPGTCRRTRCALGWFWAQVGWVFFFDGVVRGVLMGLELLGSLLVGDQDRVFRVELQSVGDGEVAEVGLAVCVLHWSY